MMDTRKLLADYVSNGSDAAFRDLVGRYINFVYSTALRLMDGDSQLAEDVTQVVFVHLARNAGKLSREPMLGGWLHRDACFVASKIKRSEQRRQAREREAVLMNSLQDHSEGNLEKLAPILDEAINQLGNEDRHAILLRFYEERDFKSLGAALGSSEDAARMRVTRALEKLHGLLKRQGVALSATALGSLLATGTVAAAPAGLAGSVAVVATTALAGATGATTATSVGILAMTKIKAMIAVPLLVAGVATTLWIQTRASLRDTQEMVVRNREEFTRLQSDNERLSALANSATPLDQSELLKLRGQVGVLTRQLAEAKQARPQMADFEEPQLNDVERRYMVNMLRQQYLTRLKMGYAKNWMVAFHMYSAENAGQWPSNFAQASAYLQKDGDDTIFMATNDFQLVFKGPLPDGPRSDVVVFTSTPELVIPSDPAGGWYRLYAFADGHVERLQSADDNFDDVDRKFGLEPDGN